MSFILNKNSVIVVPYSDKSLSYVAHELLDFIRKTCGLKLRISKKFISEKNNIVLVNTKYFDCGIEANEENLNYEGFVHHLKYDSVFICGGNSISVMYGVYEFAEKFLGVKFINWDETFYSKKAIVEIDNLNTTVKPIFRFRNYYTASNDEEPLFSIKKRLNSDFSKFHKELDIKSEWFQEIPTSHNSFCYVPESLMEKHPEFFIRYTNKKAIYNDLCYSNGITEDGTIDETLNESVIKYAVKSLKNYITKSPDSKFFMFGRQDDEVALCYCETCVRRREILGETGIMLTFCNALSDEITSWALEICPDREINLVTFAYLSTEIPPVIKEDGKYIAVHKSVIPRKNIFIRLAPLKANYTYSFTDERQNERERFLFEGWSALTNNLMIWDYGTNYADYSLYYPNFRYLKDNISYYRNLKVIYAMTLDGYNEKFNWQADLKLYVVSKLYWDLSLDPQQLADEYIDYYYGAASNHIKMYIKLTEEYFYNLIDNHSINIGRDIINPKYFDINIYNKGMSLLSDAAEAVDNSDCSAENKEKLKLRILLITLTSRRWLIFNYDNIFEEGKQDFEKSYYSDCDKVGMRLLGETTPLKLSIIKDGKTQYQIVVPADGDENIDLAVKNLNDYIFSISGVRLEVISESEAIPTYAARYIVLGMTQFFNHYSFPVGKLLKDEYFIASTGRLKFVHCENAFAQNGVNILIKDMVIDKNNIYLYNQKKTNIKYKKES